MNEEATSRSEELSARRRLLRGTFAVPAALTLCSGSAFAAASSLRVLQNQFQNPELPQLGAVEGTWVRVQLYKSGDKLVVKGAEVASLGAAVDLNFVSDTGWATATDPSASHTEVGDEEAVAGQYAALRFNESGVIIGVSTAKSSIGTAVTQSALDSFGCATCN